MTWALGRGMLHRVMQYRGPTSLASLAHGIVRWAEGEGIERDRLLRAASVDAGALAANDARIPREAHVALWRETERLLADPAFGLRSVDAIVTPASLGVVGLLAMTSRNVGESVERSMRYGRLLKEDVFARAHVEGDLLVVELGLPASSPPAIADASLAAIRRSMERWTGERIRVREVFFQHPRPSYAADYDRVFQCPVRFGHAKNAIVFDREVAELRLTTAQPEVASYLDGLARAKLAELTVDRGVLGVDVDLLPPPARAIADVLGAGRRRPDLHRAPTLE
ncbi:MAG: AraC family transcriptional regulator [Polyangiaceae bacterium]